MQWYLEGLDVSYEFVLLDMQQGKHLQPDFLSINPIGKVPAIASRELTAKSYALRAGFANGL